MDLTIAGLYAWHCKIYTRRNCFHFRGIEARVDYFMAQAKKTQDGIRKSVPKIILQRRFARLLNRLFCVADYYGSKLPLAAGFAKKYLSDCAYCHNHPCVCLEIRPDPIPGPINPEAMNMDLRQIAAHLNSLYGEKNAKGGIDYQFLRLFSEVAEISNLISMLPFKQGTLDELEAELIGELSDALAWIIVLTNSLEIDLQAAWEEQFAGGCPKCHSVICKCPPFFIKNNQ